MRGKWKLSGLRYSREQAGLAKQNRSLGVMNLPPGVDGNTETLIMSSSDHIPGRTKNPISDGSASGTMPQLTEEEKSRLYVIRREVGRGYALTMKDIQWLVELTKDL